MAEINYDPPGPIAKEFILSDAFVCGLRGPVGSGKSTAAVMKLIRNAQKQTRGRDGWIRRRTAIVRNTYSELNLTTIKTWHQWISRDVGHFRGSSPPIHHIVDNAKKFDWEIIFLALDRPDDVKKLLSFEISDAWINEAKEVPKAVLDALTSRVGRFPPRDEEFGTTDAQVIMDTNPPDMDHWWYILAERDLSNERNRAMHASLIELEAQLKDIGGLRQNQKLFSFHAQPGGRSEGAENLKHLQTGYYLKASAGKSEEWIKIYVDGQYGFVMDGKPMFPEYRDSIHCRPFELHKSIGLRVGFDWGLTPAALFGQLLPTGQWRIRSEIVSENMGIPRFAELVKQHIAQNYDGFKIAGLHGDPSGSGRHGDERTTFDMMRAVGLEVMPAPGNNDPTLRREALAKPLRTMVDGDPCMLVHPDCTFFRKGMAGGYMLKRIQVSGDEKYRDVPDKNMYSHICEAGEYLALGGGEGRALIAREPVYNRPQFAIDDYNIFG